MLKKCWNEYKLWLKEQWNSSWVSLKDSIITLLNAFCTWFYTILGSIFLGFYQLVLKPIIMWLNQKVIDWINKL